MKRYRMYCIGYEPRGVPYTRAEMEQIMEGADVCALAPAGIPVGLVVREVQVVLSGANDRGVPEGRVNLRCVGHEHGGKIAIMEDWSS